MKRLSEEAGVDDDDGCSNSEPGKKVRVLDTTTGFCLQESDMEIQDHRENGGIRVLNPIEVKVSDSEEQDSSGNQQIENKPMFMEEDKAFRRSEGCGFRDSERCNDNDHERDLGNTGPVSVCCNSASSEPITRVDYDVRGRQENAEFDLNVEQFDIDLNLPAMETEESKNVGGFQEHNQLVAQRVDIIEVSSDESEEDRGGEQGGRISVSGGRRYTREDKGKVELVDSSWLSLDLIQQDLIDLRRCIASQPEETSQLLKTEISQFGREGETASARQADRLRERRKARNRYRAISHDDARRFARFNSHQEHYVEPLKQETQMLTTEADKNLENFMGPFSTAMKLVKERKSKLSAQLLINWKPLNDHDRNILKHRVPSLLDLSMKVLAENANEIVSLECVPDVLKHRFADMLCDSRKMNVHALDLLVQGSPTEIRIKDCSWLTEEQFTEIFASFDAKNLKVLQLDLCGQCVHGDSLGKTVARSRNSLPDLAIISLKGACRLTDIALKELVASAPALQSINLGECSLLTCTSIYILATYLGAILRELYIDNCHQIDAKLIALTMRNFKHLEVLSVAGIQTVCDEFLVDIITKCGQNLKELDLADCLKLTNISMEVIGNTCSRLCSLNISNLHKLTDLAIQYLANGCQSLQKLKFRDNGFSDEAIAAFLETSGKSLKELSLNKLGKVGPNTAFSLAKCSKELLSLDLSWCRKITNESLGLIVDSCLSLKLLKLFGCTQISDEFLNCHSNSQVTIIGLSRTPVVEQLNMPGPEVAYLRYSPLTLSFDSQSSIHSDS